MQFLIGALVTVAVLVSAGPVQAQSTVEPPGFEDRAEAYYAFVLGRSLEGTGDVDGAVDAYRRAAALDPGASGIWAELAALYARRNQPDSAIEAANEALDRDADDMDAHRILGLVYAARAGSRENPSRDDVDRATEHLERARNPQRPDAGLYITLARLHLSTGSPDAAIEVLDEVLNAEPQFAEALVLLGAAREAKGEWEGASAAYEQAVLYNPRRARYRRQLANALLNSGQTDRAREVARDLVEFRPDDVSGWYLLSDIELQLGNFDDAETAARRLMELEADSLRGAYMLSRALTGKRDYRGLVDVLGTLVRGARENNLQPSQIASLLQRLSLAHHRLGELDRAAAVLSEALELTPSDLGLQIQLAQLLIDASRFEEAATVVNRAKELRPDSLALTRLEAQTLLEQGRVNDAVVVLEEARTQHADDPVAHVALAGVYSEHDRVDDAVSVLVTAEELFPDSSFIAFQLGAVLERNQRFSEAEGAFRRVLAHSPDDAPTLNYLGYMLVERGERLDESVDLITRALALDPQNGSYLDSLGWAYFRQNRLELAEEPLRQASEQLPENSVVQDHWGDLLFRLGRYTAAIEAWQRALSGDAATVDLSAVESKIEDAEARLQ